MQRAEAGNTKLKIFIQDHPIWVSFLLYVAVALLFAILTDGVLNDDAYIFFQYARNLAATGTLSFNPGETSYGVTSVLWTLLLAAGTFVLHHPIVVAKIFGALLGSVGAIFWSKWLFGAVNKPISLFAVAFAALWPTIGADSFVTGMENALVCFLTGWLLLTLTSKKTYRIWLIGVICGLLFLARPEMLIAVAALIIYLGITEGAIQGIKVTITALLISFWWPLWLYNATGAFIPPTMTGKMSVFLPEHLHITIDQFKAGGILDHIKWGIAGLIDFAKSSVSSVVWLGLVALSGAAVIWVKKKTDKVRWYQLAIAPIAAVVLMLLFGFKFPLLQLRYFVWLVPALVFSFYAAVESLLNARTFRIFQISLLIIFLLALPGSLMRRIDSTKVQQLRRQVGETIRQNTPTDARIALEPIGGIGYYGERYIVDMGGLINTSIQPYLHNGYEDTKAIWQALVDYKADYLIAYDHDGFLGRLPRDYPDRFQFITYIPETPLRNTRYRLLKIIRE